MNRNKHKKINHFKQKNLVLKQLISASIELFKVKSGITYRAMHRKINVSYTKFYGMRINQVGSIETAEMINNAMIAAYPEYVECQKEVRAQLEIKPEVTAEKELKA